MPLTSFPSFLQCSVITFTQIASQVGEKGLQGPGTCYLKKGLSALREFPGPKGEDGIVGVTYSRQLNPEGSYYLGTANFAKNDIGNATCGALDSMAFKGCNTRCRGNSACVGFVIAVTKVRNAGICSDDPRCVIVKHRIKMQ